MSCRFFKFATDAKVRFSTPDCFRHSLLFLPSTKIWRTAFVKARRTKNPPMHSWLTNPRYTAHAISGFSFLVYFYLRSVCATALNVIFCIPRGKNTEEANIYSWFEIPAHWKSHISMLTTFLMLRFFFFWRMFYPKRIKAERTMLSTQIGFTRSYHSNSSLSTNSSFSPII